MSDDAAQGCRVDRAAVCEETLAPQLQDKLAGLYRALGHPARLAILRSLSENPGACCGDIVGRLPLAQSTVSQHLQVLKEARLVTCQIRGRSCHYQIDKTILDKTIAASAAFLQAVQAGVEAQGASCCGDVPSQDCSCGPETSMETSFD